MSSPATSLPDGDRHPVPDLAPVTWRDPDAAAAIAVVLAVASLIISGSPSVARVLVVASVVAALPAAWRGVRTVPGALAAAIIVVWPVYGWLVGAMPPLTDIGLLADWLDTDARFLYPTVLVVSMSGLRRPRTLVTALTVAFWMVVVGVASGLVVAPFRDAARSGDLIIGFTSSHHVQGALAMSGLLLAVAIPTLTRRPLVRAGTGVLMVIGLALSGSRAAALGALAGCVLVVLARHRHDRRMLLRAAGALCVVALLAVVAVPRVRTTAADLTSGAFISDAIDVFRREAADDPALMFREQASANALTRVRLWRRAIDFTVESPLVGAGAFRFNDHALQRTGVRRVAYPVTDALNYYSDRQAHNTYLHVLAETGAIGLTLYVAPWVVAWRRTRPTASSTVGRPGPAIASSGHAGTLVEIRVAARAFIVAGAAAGMVAEGVFSPALGVPVVIVAFGGATVWFARDAEVERPPVPGARP